MESIKNLLFFSLIVLFCDAIGITIGLLVGQYLFPRLDFVSYWTIKIQEYTFRDGQTFWTFIAAIATSSAVIVALQPVREKARLGKALFEDAVQIDIAPDGVFTIYNIFDEPVVIKKIFQSLTRGTELSLSVTAPSAQIAKAIKNVPPKRLTTDRMSKSLAPKIGFIYAQSLTHLPAGYQTESLWIVKTKIEYVSRGGTSKLKQTTHRFSITLEPRNRWVEVL